MGRHSSIQLLLLSLTGCSWMLLFVSLTLSDYHAFKAYHAAHVAAAHTTPVPTTKEIDPCDLCWGRGNNPRSSLQHSKRGVEDELSGFANWRAKLARVMGIPAQRPENRTRIPRSSSEKVGGIGAFYYYTLHTTFTSLRIRLKKAQQVAGDVKTDVQNLESKVASLQETLTTQFSPKLNPYQNNVSVSMTEQILPESKKGNDLPSRSLPLRDSKKGNVLPSRSLPPNLQLIKNKISNDLNKHEIESRTSTPQPTQSPVNDIYALLYDQTKSIYSEKSTSKQEKSEDNKFIKSSLANTRYSNSFSIARSILLYTQRKKNKTSSTKMNYRFPNPFNKTKIFLNYNTKRMFRDVHNSKESRTSKKEIKLQTVAGESGEKQGFKSANMILTEQKISEVVSVVIVEQGYSLKDLLRTLAKQYPWIMVHLVTSSSLHLDYKLRVMVHNIPHNTSIGSAYTIALGSVTTQYTFIATNVTDVLSAKSLQKLIWATEHLGVWAASGSLLTPNGKWHEGCLDMQTLHYKVSWSRRKLSSAAGCSVCFALEGPFLALTSALQYLLWDENLKNSIAQLDLFFRASQNHYMLSAVCPQVLLNVTHYLQPPSKASILGFAKKHSFYTVTVPERTNIKFTCDEVAASCSTVGLALPPCCRQELAQLVRFFMDICDSHGLLCELEEGTLLGAVKTANVMPWERDADITFHTNNFTALGELKDVFESAGYTLHLVDNRWCCVDGRWAGGQGTLNSDHWSLELYSQHAMDSELDLLSHRPRTRIEFDGSWVTAPSSPGLYARNRYGTELYRHAQHWLDTGRKSGWEEYDPGQFLPCSRPTHHACLDQYLPDGNMKLHPQCLK